MTTPGDFIQHEKAEQGQTTLGGNGSSTYDTSKTQPILERTYGLLSRLSRWPTWVELDDDLDRGAGFDDPWEALRSVDRSLVWGLGDHEPPDTQVVGLTVAGLRRVPAAEEDLLILAQTILGAVVAARSATAGTPVLVTDEVILANVDLPAERRANLFPRQHALWSGLGRLWTRMSGAADVGGWELELNRKQLRSLRRAETARDIIDLLVAAPTSASDGPAAPGSFLGSTREKLVAENGIAFDVDYSTVLGHGSHGDVYAGVGPEGDPVAVKVVGMRTNAGTEPWYRDARLALREAVIGVYVDAQGVDGVVPLLGQLLDGGRLFLFFPRAATSLDAVIASRRATMAADAPSLARNAPGEGSSAHVRGAPSDADVRRIAIELATGLHQLHLRGVMHRDIKPGNALLWSGRWCWSDLGIARVLSNQTETFTFTLGGTMEYSAPEVVAHAGQTLRSDVYSLGCTLYELATGRLPFPTDHARRHLSEVADFDAIADPVLRRAVTYALAKTPGARPSAEQLLNMLTGPSALNAEYEQFRKLAARGRRREDEHAALGEHVARRAQHSEDALTQLRRIWEDFVEAARAIDPDATGFHEDKNRYGLRLYDDRLISFHTAPADGTCPATAVGILSMQRANERSRAVANTYAMLDDDESDSVSRWRLVQLQPNFIRTGKTQRATQRPWVPLDDLERWLARRATEQGPPEFVVVGEEDLTVTSLMELFVTEAELP